MTPETNIAARQALTDAASAIQDLTRAFTDDRTPNAIRNDLVQASARLRAALDNIDTAFNFIS